MHYLLGLTLEEFTTWSQLGELRLTSSRLVPVGYERPTTTLAAEVAASALALLPDFQEAHEVAFALLDLQRQPAEVAPGPPHLALLAVSFTAICSVHPVTIMATSQLARRLRGMKIGPVLTDRAFAAESQRRLDRQFVLGGRALLQLTGLDGYATEFEQKYGADARSATQIREAELLWPEAPNTIWEAVFLYDRRDATYPSTDMGYAFDLAAQFTRTRFGLMPPPPVTGENVKGQLLELKAALSAAQPSQVTLATALPRLLPIFDELARLTTQKRFPAGAALTYFLLRHELRATDQPDWNAVQPKLRVIYKALHALGREREFGLGVWATGYFLGFRAVSLLVLLNTHELFGNKPAVPASKERPSAAEPPTSKAPVISEVAPEGTAPSFKPQEVAEKGSTEASIRVATGFEAMTGQSAAELHTAADDMITELSVAPSAPAMAPAVGNNKQRVVSRSEPDTLFEEEPTPATNEQAAESPSVVASASPENPKAAAAQKKPAPPKEKKTKNKPASPASAGGIFNMGMADALHPNLPAHQGGHSEPAQGAVE